MKRLSKWLTLSLAVPLVTLNLWVLSWIFHVAQPLATLFIVANLLAFILDYPVQLLQDRGVRRSYGILVIVLLALSAVSVFGFTLVPVLLKQLTDLASCLPNWIEST